MSVSVARMSPDCPATPRTMPPPADEGTQARPPSAADVLYDITEYLNGSSIYGGDRAYRVQQITPWMLRVTVTDIDTVAETQYILSVSVAR